MSVSGDDGTGTWEMLLGWLPSRMAGWGGDVTCRCVPGWGGMFLDVHAAAGECGSQAGARLVSPRRCAGLAAEQPHVRACSPSDVALTEVFGSRSRLM